MSFSALRNVGFVLQTIHKLYTNKPQTLHKTQHCNYAQNPAQQRCILFLNADKNVWSECIASCGDARRVTSFCLAVFRLMRVFRTIHIQKPLMNPFMSIHGEKRWRSSTEKNQQI